jgi:hypothetical protein
MVSKPPAAQALTDGVDVQHFEFAAGRWTEIAPRVRTPGGWRSP